MKKFRKYQNVFQGKNQTDLFDVGITNYFFFRDEEKRLGKAERVSFFDYFKVIYLLSTQESILPNFVFLCFPI